LAAAFGQRPSNSATKAFELELGGKWPKATAKITYDLDELLSFYDFPLEHWIHLRTSNPILVNRPMEAQLAKAA
jgi:transposase-like protein